MLCNLSIWVHYGNKPNTYNRGQAVWSYNGGQVDVYDLTIEHKKMCGLKMVDKKVCVILQWWTRRCVILQWWTRRCVWSYNGGQEGVWSYNGGQEDVWSYNGGQDVCDLSIEDKNMFVILKWRREYVYVLTREKKREKTRIFVILEWRTRICVWS